MNYVSPAEASKYYNVTDQTLRRWEKAGKILCKTTAGGHRRYAIKSKKDTAVKFIYARVSSSKQQKDLESQIKFLKEKYPRHTVIKDIGSGLNFKRPGLNKILDTLFKGNLGEVVVASKDRLTRFGFDLFENIFWRFNAQIRVVNNDQQYTPQEELAEDLLSIVTVFTAKHHGRRKYNTKKSKNKEDKNLSNKKSKKNV